jgi:RNA polymerase sigma factor for flagellar operon FliA
VSAVAACAEERANRALDHAAYERFQPLVRRTAMRFARRVPRHITVADLVGYGWVGLMEAYRRADPNMPPKEFEAYASYRVRGAILDYLRSLDPATRELRRSSRNVADAIRKLTGEKVRAPEEDEIAAALSLSVDDYRDLLQRISTGGMARLELLDIDNLEVEDANKDIDEGIGEKQLSVAVAEAITHLPSRLQQILALYYQEDCKLREIGAILGVSESRVCQLLSEAIHRLRATVGRS